MNTAPVQAHANCGAGFYAIGRDGMVRCGLCGEAADVNTGHATVISAAVVASAIHQRPILRVVK